MTQTPTFDHFAAGASAGRLRISHTATINRGFGPVSTKV
jgi:hypothetical protein